MELDNRIKSLSDVLTCFDIERAKDFLGEKGYFGDLYCFTDLQRECPYGTLADVFGDSDDVFQRREDNIYYSCFVPECSLKPKARAFTKDEFEDRFKVGDPVRYFVNGSDELLTGQIVCYTFIPENPDRSLEIYIAGMRGPHKAEWLFDNVRYQPKDSDHFIPFGVEDA